jgi:hypothetical protein
MNTPDQPISTIHAPGMAETVLCFVVCGVVELKREGRCQQEIGNERKSKKERVFGVVVVVG